MQTIKVQTSQNIDIDYEVAGLGDRIVAWLVDFGVFFALAMVLLIIMTAMSWDKVVSVTIIVIYVILYACYDLLCEAFFNGQSIGKRVMKIKVISMNGARPSISQYVLRWLFRIVDFSLTSGVCAFLTVAISYKRQRVGDIVAGTTLIKTRAPVKIDTLVFAQVPDEYTPVFDTITQLSDNDLALIHEVINNFKKTGNSVLIYNMATRVKQHLAITTPTEMTDFQFLQTVIKDYSYLTAIMEP